MHDYTGSTISLIPMLSAIPTIANTIAMAKLLNNHSPLLTPYKHTLLFSLTLIFIFIIDIYISCLMEWRCKGQRLLYWKLNIWEVLLQFNRYGLGLSY